MRGDARIVGERTGELRRGERRVVERRGKAVRDE
jgi:hypothetical protein